MGPFIPPIISIILAAFLAGPGETFADGAESSPRSLVHLLDYVAQDYSGAVQDGKIINGAEFKEQLEFSEMAIEISQNLGKTSGDPDIRKSLDRLHKIILLKANAEKVAGLAQEIKGRVIDLTGLQVAPSRWPNLNNGKTSFGKNCIACHGDLGKGDGPAGISLSPRPTNLLEDLRMKKLSPFQIFNTVRLGVPGTSMPSFPALSDMDNWNLSFYVLSLQHQAGDPGGRSGSPEENESLGRISLQQVATLSDTQLIDLLPGSDDEKKRSVGQLRLRSGDETKSSLETARSYLNEALDQYRVGNVAASRSKALLAYLDGIEPIESRLRAVNAAATMDLEQKMASVRGAIESRKSPDQVGNIIQVAREAINNAEYLLKHRTLSPWLMFIMAAAILLREGFEAVLMIITLLGILRAAGSVKGERWVHFGWLAALGLGFLLWIFSGWLMGVSGAQRELMEGFTSLLAVVVLLFMGFWLHSRTELGRWHAFVNGRIKGVLAQRNMVGLGLIAFTAVFREVFETVLFLRALWLEGGAAMKTALASGVFVSLGLTLVSSWILLKNVARIPIRKLFTLSSFVMALLAFILMGKGLHSLQESGMMSVTGVSVDFSSDWLGLYPTWETTLSQIAVVLLIGGLWIYGARPLNTSLKSQ